jgi:hypothetical protein
MAVLVEQLGLAARIGAGRYDPYLVETNTLELAAASGVPATGEGAALALAHRARCGGGASGAPRRRLRGS